jgi:diacylglycerol kinase family enzyme
MTKFELIRTLIGLYYGHFSGRPKTYTFRTKELKIKPEKFIAIETDGEVFQGTDIHFSILPRAIHVLGLN